MWDPLQGRRDRDGIRTLSSRNILEKEKQKSVTKARKGKLFQVILSGQGEDKCQGGRMLILENHIGMSLIFGNARAEKWVLCPCRWKSHLQGEGGDMVTCTVTTLRSQEVCNFNRSKLSRELFSIPRRQDPVGLHPSGKSAIGMGLGPMYET